MNKTAVIASALFLIGAVYPAYAAEPGSALRALLGEAAATAMPDIKAPAAAVSGAGLRQLTLQQVYSLPIPELEAALYKELAEDCAMAYSSGGNPHNLNRMEKCAVTLYTNSWFQTINSKLWKTDASGSALNGTEWAYVRMLDLALSKIPADRPAVLYRGTSRATAFTPGKPVRLKGYSSTTPDLETAEWFLVSDSPRIMVITASSARNIMAYTQTGQENERLLPRSTWVRPDRSEMKKVKIFDEESGADKTIEVEFVYLTEIKAP